MPKKTMPSIAPSSYTKIILDALHECGNVVWDALPSADEILYPRLSRVAYGIPRRYYRDTLRRFEKRGWVQRSEKDGKTFFALTKKGALRALGERLVKEHKQHFSSERYLLLFDIPERCRKDRDALRSLLYDLHFSQVQKSVYLGYGPSKETTAYLRASGLEKYIRCFVVKEIVDK